jgi:hypothetical protein
LTPRVPSFYPPDDVLRVLREAYGCQERARNRNLIVIACAGDRATVLKTDPPGIAVRTLAGALAVLQIDLQEFLGRLEAIPRGNGAGN